jgi:hypothetical protein
MPLPATIEHLLACEEYPGGPRLCTMGSTAFTSNAFTAGAQITYSMRPDVKDYALVIFEAYYSQFVVPNAFWNIGTQFGARSMCHIGQGEFLPYYMIVTASAPWTMWAWNNSALSQYYSLIVRYLTFPTKDSYLHGLDEIRRRGTSELLEKDMAQLAGGAK